MVSIRVISTGGFLDLQQPQLAYSLEAYNLEELERRKGEFSVDFDIPNTPANRSKLAFAPDEFLKDNTAFQRIDVEVLQNGELAKVGYLKLVEVGDVIDVTFFSGASDWISRLEGSIKDVDMSEFDHVFSNANILAGLIKTEDYIYPLIDYGFLNTIQGTTGDEMDETDLRPAVFVADLVRVMFREIAWKLSGGLVNDVWFKRLIIPFSIENFVHGESWIKDRELEALKTTTQTAIISEQITFDSAPIDPSNWNSGTHTYTADEPMTVTIQLTANFATLTPCVPDIKLEIHVNGAQVATVDATVAGVYSLEFNGNLAAADAVTAEVIDAGGCSWLMSSAQLMINGTENVLEGSTIQINATLPDISKKDLLRYVFIHRNCYIKTDNFAQTLDIGFFRDINSNSADDWTEKVNAKTTDFSKLFANYAQATRMKYETNDDDAQLSAYKEANEGKHYGDGSLAIDNEFLDAEKEFYDAPFAGTVNVQALKGRSNMPFIPVSSNGTDFTEVQDPTPRILYVIPNISLALSTDNGEIVFTTATKTVGNFAFFFKKQLSTDLDNIDESLAFDAPNINIPSGRGLLAKYFAELSDIFARGKIETFLLSLSEIDAREWDIARPVLITFEGGTKLYYKNKLRNFDADNPVHEVELIPFE